MSRTNSFEIKLADVEQLLEGDDLIDVVGVLMDTGVITAHEIKGEILTLTFNGDVEARFQARSLIERQFLGRSQSKPRLRCSSSSKTPGFVRS